jgi:diguanylate cyclase (GGDEF)-like protein
VIIYYLDLDRLKEINDNYGHQEGDFALLESAEIIRKSFRESDILGRIGGDEFVVFTTGENNNKIDAVTKRIESYINKANTTHNKPYQISFSVVYAVYNKKNQKATLEELLHEADKDLYKNKKQKKEQFSQ